MVAVPCCQWWGAEGFNYASSAPNKASSIHLHTAPWSLTSAPTEMSFLDP